MLLLLLPLPLPLTRLPCCHRPYHWCAQADGSPNPLMLNDVAEALGVPRRRLYDVINVFESIEVRHSAAGLLSRSVAGLLIAAVRVGRCAQA